MLEIRVVPFVQAGVSQAFLFGSFKEFLYFYLLWWTSLGKWFFVAELSLMKNPASSKIQNPKMVSSDTITFHQVGRLSFLSKVLQGLHIEEWCLQPRPQINPRNSPAMITSQNSSSYGTTVISNPCLDEAPHLDQVSLQDRVQEIGKSAISYAKWAISLWRIIKVRILKLHRSFYRNSVNTARLTDCLFVSLAIKGERLTAWQARC